MSGQIAYIQEKITKFGTSYRVTPTKKFTDVFPNFRGVTVKSNLDAKHLIKTWDKKWEIHTSGGENTEVYSSVGTVEQLISAWQGSIAYKDNTASTQRNYHSIVDRLLHWKIKKGKRFGLVKVDDVDYEYAQRIFQAVAEDVTWNNARITIIRLRSAWNEGRRLRLATNNPFVDVKLPKAHVRRVMWTPEQVKEMIKFCDANGKVSIGTAITICYEWMQRPVDVRLLKWADFQDEGMGEFTQQKTKAEMRIPVTVGIAERLKLHRKHNSDDFIIRNERTKKPYSADRLTKIFANVRLASGILPKVRDKGKTNEDGSYVYTDVRLADLRRSGVTHGSECGCTHDELMSISGHKNIASLMVYSVITETNAHNALAKRGLDTVGFKKLGREMQGFKKGNEASSLLSVIAEQNRIIAQLRKEVQNG